MRGQIHMVSQARRCATICVLIFLATAPAHAQSPPGGGIPQAQASPTPQAKPSPTLERRFLANILRDQRAIWTSPFHLKGGDVSWLAPLGLATGVLIATDRGTAHELVAGGENRSRLRISRNVSLGGNLITTGGIAAAFYLVGRKGNNARARETGLLGAEALINAHLVTTGLKLITQRPRPRFDEGRGRFLHDGDSFPSGHASGSWALATVVAHEYKRHRLVQVAAYGLASAVSISRYTGQKHFLSDVLVGSAIGYGIGRYVYYKNHDPTLDSSEGATNSVGIRSKLMPSVSPSFSRARRTYGLALAWNF